MTNKQITLANLKIARKKLVEFADYYPSIKEEFDMKEYGHLNSLSRRGIKELPACGTYGCLLGSMTLCFKIAKEDFEKDYIGNVFKTYLFGRRLFPYIYEENIHWNLWPFLFNSDWTDYQPTFEQAIERLDWVIKHKLDIPNWKLRKKSFK